jgi:uncharacterized protein (TIGR02996 family)
MAADDALLEACRWAPDDDAPRLVWADAVGGERGELVVIQCELARGGLAPAHAAILRRRERELVKKCGLAWSGLGEIPLKVEWASFEFRRGFVEVIGLDARAFTEYGEAIFHRAPLLRTLTATGLMVGADPLAALRELIQSPSFRHLHELSLPDDGYEMGGGYDDDPNLADHADESYGDDVARLLVESGVLAHLTGLGISLTDAGVYHLVASGELGHVERLQLAGRPGGDAVLAMLGRAPRLKSFSLWGATELEEIVPALPPMIELSLSLNLARDYKTVVAALPSVTRLCMRNVTVTDQMLAIFGGSSAAATVETLTIHGHRSRSGWLEWDGDIPALPRLRRLQALYGASTSEVRLIARALGLQLEELTLSGRYEPDLVDELKAHVAGEVLLVDWWHAGGPGGAGVWRADRQLVPR